MAKRILISGSISRLPLGGAGNTWAFLQYILGFRRLGFETYYVEFLGPKECIEEDGEFRSFRHLYECSLLPCGDGSFCPWLRYGLD